MPLREDVKQRQPEPGEAARGTARGEGDRYLVEDIAGGLVRVTIDRGHDVLVHIGPAAGVRARAAIDADARDRAAIDTALPAQAGGGRAVARDISERND